MGARRRQALACVLLVAGVAAQLLVPHRGADFGRGAGLFFVAGAGYLLLARDLLQGTWAPSFRAALALAAALRLLALPLAPELSDDVYRYLFEGRVVLAGENPFLVAPGAPELEPLRDAWWSRVNNKDVASVYPPTLQLVFAACTWAWPHPMVFKLLFGLCDLLVFVVLWRCLPLAGVPAARACLYGLCPLVVLEFAGEGHSDSLGILCLWLALWAALAARPGAAGVALALATGAKLLPAALLPALQRRSWRAVAAFGLVLVALYLPFWGPPAALFRGTLEYAARWRNNDSAYGVVQWLVERVMAWQPEWFHYQEAQRLAKLPLLLAGSALLCIAWLWRWSAHRTGFAFFTFFVVCAPTLHPWYVALWLPFLCLRANLLLLAFPITVYLNYHVLPGWLAEGVWREVTWVKVIEYAPLYAGLLWLAATRRAARLSAGS